MSWFKKIFRWKESLAAHDAPASSAVLAALPWETVTMSGAKALEAILALRAQSATAIPVALGDDEDLERVLEAMGYNEASTGEIISAGEAIDIAAWIESSISADREYYEQDQSAPSSSGEPVQVRPLSLAFHVLSGKPKKRVHIALIPTHLPWHVPAHLKFGDWNECPAAEVHVAFFKSWFERYGAVVTAVGPDTVEFSVATPPETLEEARLLAREQFVYCADIVHQGVQSVENLARVLVNSGNWYFWWD